MADEVKKLTVVEVLATAQKLVEFRAVLLKDFPKDLVYYIDGIVGNVESVLKQQEPPTSSLLDD